MMPDDDSQRKTEMETETEQLPTHGEDAMIRVWPIESSSPDLYL